MGKDVKSLGLRPGRGAALIAKLGGRFSVELGIDLTAGGSREIFKWFLAAMLFGARISETIAVKTYREFEKERINTPREILKRGWDAIVAVLDRGGYVRYDFSTATKLLAVSEALVTRYGGNLNALQAAALDPRDLELKLKALGKGIGDVTTNIFLRELRGIWPKADPLPSELVITAAKDLGLLPERLNDKRRALQLLRTGWTRERGSAKQFADFEAALVRHGLAMRRKRAALSRGAKAGALVT